jgi:hypothetical protein
VTITTSGEQLMTAIVEHHLVAAEQILKLDAADLRYRDPPDSRSS